MSKVNKPGSQKPQQTNPKAADAKKPAGDKQSGKGRKPEIGGRAAAGAKSTQPKEITSTDPRQQQAESYNRQMRRRMEHLGTGPYTESPTLSVRDRKKKRLERKKQEHQQEVRKVVAKGPNPTRVGNLGRKNTYFILGVVAVLAFVIVLFLIIRHPF